MSKHRTETLAVRRYLNAMEKPKGRNKDPQGRLQTVQAELAEPNLDVLKRVGLVQERLDLTAQIETETAELVEWAEAQREFVEHAASYGRRKGICYAAWRACGVSASVLKEAGIKP
jgi:hypothetical protein